MPIPIPFAKYQEALSTRLDRFTERYMEDTDHQRVATALIFGVISAVLVGPMACANLVAGEWFAGAVLFGLCAAFFVACTLYYKGLKTVGSHIAILVCTVGIETVSLAKGGLAGSPVAWIIPTLLVAMWIVPLAHTAVWVAIWSAIRVASAIFWVPEGYSSELLGPPWLYAASTIAAMLSVFVLSAMFQMTMTRSQDLIRARATEATAASAAKSAFLANMSHEIRTPLNGVLGLTDVLLVGDATPAEQLHMLRTIQRSGRTLKAILDDVLDLSRIEAGAMGIETAVIDTQELLQDVQSLFTEAAQAKGLVLSRRLDGTVPPSVMGDPLRTQQILQNLVGNAIKFTHTGSVLLTCTVDASQLIFRVSDTGVGIDPDRLKEVFGAFQQEDSSTTRRYGGSGLGLAISRQLAELMHGTLTLHPGLHGGTHATLTLPLVEAPSDSILEITVTPSDTAPGRIWVAEDNPVNQMVIQSMLRQLGHEVHVVPNGQALLDDLACKEWPDLVLMDCHMPVMDGFDAAEAVRRLNHAGAATLPIVALTASVMDDDRRRCLAAGMDAILTKPVQSEVLQQVIARHLTRARRDAA